MKLYGIDIEPLSAFSTPLKGDGVFGHFCWQAAHLDLFNNGVVETFEKYDNRPFAVFSSAYPKLSNEDVSYALKRPDLPLSLLFPSHTENKVKSILDRKANKKKQWMLLGSDLRINLKQVAYFSDAQVADKIRISSNIRSIVKFSSTSASFLQSHNSINRATGSTGAEAFAPYTQNASFYCPGMRLTIFAAVDHELCSLESILKGMKHMGLTGFGKDASTGKGRFEITNSYEVTVKSDPRANVLYCLGPIVPRPNSFTDHYFVPFTRFGKHGDYLASGKSPFKNPIIMADEGAVFMPSSPDDLKRLYFGTAIRGISKAMPQTIMQGYSICLPLYMEVQNG